MYKFFLIVILIVVQSLSVLSQESHIIPRLDAEIAFDGKTDEEVWDEIQSFSFITHQPVFGRAPSEKTECMMFFDDRYLYIGANLYYSDISLLSNVGKQRDYFSSRPDWFGILLDTYNDKENSMAFYTTPGGLRFDATVKNDASSGMDDINVSWNTFWDVSTTHDDKGWYIEMRIPISSLRFQEEDGIIKMG
ncbi:MAG TPA: hypothetical protein DEQ09_01730 [Bacteroidales bacterium]|nr:hypothetical protein [Bacteroidales bacterium]